MNNTNNLPKNKKIAIVGAGLVGGLEACLMARRGYEVHLYEFRDDIRLMEHVPGRSINLAMSIRGRTGLREIGVEEKIIRDHGIPMRGRMIHGRDGSLKPIPYNKDGKMVRHYIRKNSRCHNYTGDDIARALIDLGKGESLREVGKRYGIPVSTLHNRIKGKSQSPGQSGRNTAFLKMEELDIAQNLATFVDFGLAFTSMDLRKFIKEYLDSSKRIIPRFVDNMPGPDWAESFLRRHHTIIGKRKYQYISPVKVAARVADIEAYFNNLRIILQNVPPENIVNYGEANFIDDSGMIGMLLRRGGKRAERIDTCKVSISVMFACTPVGNVLPPYIVYKGEQLYDSWVQGGLSCVKYNISSSGLFDPVTFKDWLQSVLVPYFKFRRLEGPKVILGENLPSHISLDMVEICDRNNIKMVFLPPELSHILQPLDVAFFSPMKNIWRHIITKWKEQEGEHYHSIFKASMPKLIMQFMKEIAGKWETYCNSGFEACGIVPFNPEQVFSKLSTNSSNESPGTDLVSLELLPGVDISLADLMDATDSGTLAQVEHEEEQDKLEKLENSPEELLSQESSQMENFNAELLEIDQVNNKMENFSNENIKNVEEKYYVEAKVDCDDINQERDNIKEEEYEDIDLNIEPSHKNEDIPNMTHSAVKEFPLEIIHDKHYKHIKYEDVSIKEEKMNFIDVEKIFIKGFDENNTTTTLKDSVSSISEDISMNESYMKQPNISENILNSSKTSHENYDPLNINSNVGPINSENSYSCSKCNFITFLHAEIMNHIEEHKIKALSRCIETDNDTVTKPDTKNPRKHSFKCTYCDYVGSFRSQLHRHIRTHTGEKPFSCTYCNFKASDKSVIRRHVSIHTNDKPFECSYCDYKASEYATIQKHVRIHTGERPFHCTFCDYRASQKSCLNTHMRIHQR